MVRAFQLDLQDEILSECAGDGMEGNEGGGSSSDSKAGDDIETFVEPPPYADVAEQFNTLEAKFSCTGPAFLYFIPQQKAA